MNVPTEHIIEGGAVLYGVTFAGWGVYARRIVGDVEELRAAHEREVESNGRRWIDAAKFLVTKAEVETHFHALEQKVEALNNLLVLMIRNNKGQNA